MKPRSRGCATSRNEGRGPRRGASTKDSWDTAITSAWPSLRTKGCLRNSGSAPPRALFCCGFSPLDRSIARRPRASTSWWGERSQSLRGASTGKELQQGGGRGTGMGDGGQGTGSWIVKPLHAFETVYGRSRLGDDESPITHSQDRGCSAGYSPTSRERCGSIHESAIIHASKSTNQHLVDAMQRPRPPARLDKTSATGGVSLHAGPSSYRPPGIERSNSPCSLTSSTVILRSLGDARAAWPSLSIKCPEPLSLTQH